MESKIVIGICDDEQKCIDITKEYCEKIKVQLGEEFAYQIFMSGEEVLTHEGNIDILLLDIEMYGLNGIETMKKLEDSDNVKSILFVSGYSEYVFDSFGAKTKGFICKPIEYNRFEKELDKVIALLRKGKKNKLVDIIVNDEKIAVDIRRIIYIQGEGRYVLIVTDEGSYLLSENLKVWEEKLRDSNIKRVHKSYLVNYEYIATLKNMEIVLKNKEKLPLGRKYLETIKQEYKMFLFEKMRKNGK